jgi:hypothetical protein
MSKLKEFYHEQICKGFYEDQDQDHAFSEWQNELDLHLKEETEKAEFFRVFEVSGQYPM